MLMIGRFQVPCNLAQRSDKVQAAIRRFRKNRHVRAVFKYIDGMPVFSFE